ncbi:excalibur calcium-binding domain-containing protein [Aquimarina longa]|uniref:excalibur calcium-binding domain-containing protein n=1 Tax=Aquimarina longa TaxID=1080221 RepID=UPI000A53E15F|nr:excalibur calcium-binding domain-containing protein [Aquimarina longa]
MKTLYSLTFLLITFFLLSINNACTTPNPPKSETTCIDTNCEDYSSQQEAQRAYESDPECRNDLDHDSDGIACEHLNNETINDCPTTANCGCSGKSKSQCLQDPCCQWISEKGCRCN